MSPLSRSTSPTFFWILGAVIGLPGLVELAGGTLAGHAGAAVQGLCACIMASYLVYCALQLRRGNGAALAQPRARFIGFACLAVFAGAVLFKIGATAGRVFG